MATHKIPRMQARHLFRQRVPIPLIHILGKDLRFGIEMIHLPHPTPRTLPRMTERRSDEPVLVKGIHRRGRRVGDIPPLLRFHPVSVLAAGDAQRRGGEPAVRPEEGLPVLRD